MRIGVILAGGRSRRMGGGDKFLETIAGERLIDRAIRRLAPQVDRLIVSVNGNAAALAGLDLPLIEDPPGLVGLGPLSGILTAQRWAQAEGGTDSLVLSAPADAPFLPLDLMARLEAARRVQMSEIAIASSGNQLHYAVALWPAVLAGPVEAWLRRGKGSAIRDFLADRSTTVVEFAGAPEAFLNVNRPEDLERARAALSGRRER